MIRWIGIGRWCVLAVITGAAALRTMTSTARTPFWDLDPSRVTVPETAVLPSQSLMLDVLVLAACLPVVMSGRIRCGGLMWKSGACLLIGLVSAAAHGLWRRPYGGEGATDILHGSFTALVTGSAWFAALMGGWALMHLCRDDALRRATFGILFGVIGVLAAKGAHQYLFDHAEMVAQFRADPAAALAAHGMEPGTTIAREFERRLMQREATGWFGLSNVYASLGAACLAGWLGATLGARFENGAERVSRLALAAGGGALLAAGAVVMSGSKGGIAAGVLGAGVVVAVRFGRGIGGKQNGDGADRARVVGGAAAIALILAALGAVCARGLIGERIGELSLLFRWHYLIGATRVFLSEPLWGVGPGPGGGFKEAYGLFKPALNPEHVDSPHSVMFEWAATLGVFGAAWIGAWLAMIWRAGAGALVEARSAGTANTDSAGIESATRAVALVVPACAWAVANLIDRATATPGEMLARCAGLLVWFGLARAALVMDKAQPAGIRLGLAAGAIVLGVHGQIELTPTHVGAGMWVMCVIGSAAAGARRESVAGTGTKARPPRGGATATAAGAMVLLCWIAALVVRGIGPAARWESHLHAAAQVLRPVAEARRLIGERAPLDQLLGLLRAHQGAGQLMEETAINSALFELQRSASDLACRDLLRADEVIPSVAEPRIQAARLFSEVAVAAKERGERSLASEYAERAVGSVQPLVERRPNSATAWAAVAGTLTIRATVTGMDVHREASLDAWLRASRLDPHALTPALRALQIAREADDGTGAGAEEVRELARRVLQIDENLRLDPLKRLSEADRTEIGRLAALGM